MFRGFVEMFRGFAEIRGCFAGVSRIHERRFTCFAAVSQQSRIVNLCSRPVALRSGPEPIVSRSGVDRHGDFGVLTPVSGFSGQIVLP